MSQTRTGSLVESLANVVIGYLVAVAANLAILPAFGYPVTTGDAFGIGLAFTAVSLVRSYALRRLFERLRWWRAPEVAQYGAVGGIDVSPSPYWRNAGAEPLTASEVLRNRADHLAKSTPIESPLLEELERRGWPHRLGPDGGER